MTKHLIFVAGLYLAFAAGSAPAFADSPSYPVASGPQVMAPGDEGLNQHNPGLGSHVCHGVKVRDQR